MNSFFQGSDNSAMGAINDPLNFVKNLWGGMHVPGMVTPTVSIDELDKKIQDLKTVESWLNVNMTMLKGTIQALEVQRATISTLQAMGESFAQQMHQAGAAEAKPDSKPDDKHVNASWPMPEAGSVKKPVAAAVAPAEPEAPKTADTAQAKQKADSAAGSQAAAMSPFANSANLWGMLQDQFKQAVSKAMATESIPANGKPATASVSKNTPAKSAADAKPVKTSAKTAAKAQPKAVGKVLPKASAKAGTTTRAEAPLKKAAAPKAAKP